MAKVPASLFRDDPQARKGLGALLSPSTNQTEESGGQSIGQSQQNFILSDFICESGSSQIHQENFLFLTSYEEGIWKRIYCHRDLIQTESLGPVPRSLHSVSGQHSSAPPM